MNLEIFLNSNLPQPSPTTHFLKNSLDEEIIF
jgi:hypothetical protein